MEAEMVGLPDGENILRIGMTVYTQHRRVTDRLTDILPWHNPCYAYASRGKNLVEMNNLHTNTPSFTNKMTRMLNKFSCSIISVLYQSINLEFLKWPK